MNLKSGEQNIDQLKTSDPEEQYCGKFSGFSFYLIYSQLGVGESGQL